MLTCRLARPSGSSAGLVLKPLHAASPGIPTARGSQRLLSTLVFFSEFCLLYLLAWSQGGLGQRT